MMSKIMDRSTELMPFLPREDDEIIICRCEEITRGEIRRAIHDGMRTMNEVKRYTRAGMGLCQGQTCSRIIRAIIAKELAEPAKKIAFQTARAPMRPVIMKVYSHDTLDTTERGGNLNEQDK